MTYEETMDKSKILVFESTAGFKPYEKFFTEESVQHPAKANLHMLRWIIEKYTKEGEWILDPMSGTFSTCIMAALLNRNSIGVELEERFYQMGLKNKKLFESYPSLEPKGKIIILKGDARRLTEVLCENVDSIITSPPYAETFTGGGDPEKRRERLVKAGYDPKDFLGGKARNTVLKHYSENGDNIGNLPLGEIDAVITSPPYSECLQVRSDYEKRKERLKEAGYTSKTHGLLRGQNTTSRIIGGDFRYSENKDNIGNLPHGEIDAVITSPPYARTITQGGTTKVYIEKYGYQQEENKGYSESEDQIGNLPLGEISKFGSIPTNKSETYLSEMFKVYSECYKVLKPNGYMIVITKNFLRNKRAVRLDLHTIKLCELAGFKLVERWYRKLTNLSFWIINYRRKYPEAERVDYEDILVFKKCPI